MPRTPQVNWFASKNGYYCNIRGKRIFLARGKENKKLAQDRFYRLMSGKGPDWTEKAVLFGDIVEQYLAAMQGEVRKETLIKKNQFLGQAKKILGNRNVVAVSSDDIPRLVPEGCADNYKLTMGNEVHACLNWAKDKKLIAENPIQGWKRPKWKSRGRHVCWSEQEYQTMIDFARPALHDILVFLRNTGCRPKELCTLEARHFFPAQRCLILEEGEWKVDDKTRTIPLNDVALALIARLVKERPSGPLFRNSLHAPWTTAKISQAIRHLRRKLKMREGCIPYGLRHSLCTDLLQDGVSPAVVASMVGNSVPTLMNHYSHLFAAKEENIDALNRIRRE